MDCSENRIRERRWVEGNVGAADLAHTAALEALEQAGIQASDLDLIVFATLSPDINFPGSSCLLQQKLNCPGVATLIYETSALVSFTAFQSPISSFVQEV